VVWEGRSREAPPYPDLWPEAAVAALQRYVRSWSTSPRAMPLPPLALPSRLPSYAHGCLIEGRRQSRTPEAQRVEGQKEMLLPIPGKRQASLLPDRRRGRRRLGETR